MQYPGILVSVKDVWSPLVNNVCSHVRLSVLLTWQTSDLVRCYRVCTQTMVSTVSYSLSPSSTFLLSEHRITKKEGPLSGLYEGALDSLFLLYC